MASAPGGITSDSSQDATNMAGMYQNTESGGRVSSKPMADLGAASNQSKTEVCQKRRSSSRSIKRKKFDDELVESSLIKSSRSRGSGLPFSGTAVPSPTEAPKCSLDPAPVATVSSAPSTTEKKKPSKTPTAARRVKKVKPQGKEQCKWKPADDLALILGVQQTNDLEAVFLGTRFSSKFSLKDVEERWYALLYDINISKPAVAAMKQLHPDLAFQIHANALYSEKEEKLLASLPSGSPPTLDQLQDLIKAHPEVFLPQRTPKALLHHWTLMKQYSLLPDQAVVPWPASFDQATNISDAEDFLDELDLQDSPDEVVNQEVAQFERKGRREIKQLENELPKWQVIVGSITGVSVPNFDNQTLAVLRGRLVRYLMRSREITLGRSTRDNTVDVDLSLEGPSWKVSRRQGVIKLHQGEFYIYNEGKRPIYVDSRPVLTGTKAKMTNNAVIEVGCLRFIFLINLELVGSIRAETQQQAQPAQQTKSNNP